MSTLSLQQLFIDGGYVDAVSGESFETTNPANAKVICRVQQAGQDDVNRAVESAQRGYAEWSAMTGAQRGRILSRAAALLRARNEELATIEVMDTGKPLREARTVDVLSGADCIEYFGGLAATLHGHH